MWNRRVELNLYQAVSAVFRHLHPSMKDMEAQVPEWGEANRPRVFEFLALLDRELTDRMFVAGDHYTIADITALVAVDFMRPAKLIMPEEFVNLRRWHIQVGERTQRDGLTCVSRSLAPAMHSAPAGASTPASILRRRGRTVLIDCGASTPCGVARARHRSDTIDAHHPEPSARRPFRRHSVPPARCAVHDARASARS